MKKNSELKGIRSEINNAPASHDELTKLAKKLKKAPKDKYFCDVFYSGSTRVQFQLRSPLKERLPIIQKAYSKQYNDRIMTFGKIKPIKAT